ncbi:hypothetical protein D9M69_726100 [compost metagenome]
MVAHRMRGIDAVQAQAGVALPHVVGRAFACGRHQVAQHGHDHLFQRKRCRIDAVQAGHFGAQRVASVVQAADPLRMLQ